MENKEIVYGENAEVKQTVQKTSNQVQFAITKKQTSAGTVGVEGAGYVEFNESNHSIYVNGKQYGAVDVDGADVKTTYATKDELKTAQDTFGSNISGLRMFSKIGGIQAASNGDELAIQSGNTDNLTVTAADKTLTITAIPYTATDAGITLSGHNFSLDAATADSLGGVKASTDVAVATDGTMTVNHATAADKVDVVAAGQEELGIVLVSGASTTGADLKTDNTLKYVKDENDKTHLQYSGEISADTDLVTKGYVDGEVSKVVGAAADGMHYRGSVASATAVPAKGGQWGDGDNAIKLATGDFVIASAGFDYTIGTGETAVQYKVESGDYLVFNGDDWSVINKNITETNSITSSTDTALIPTTGAVRDYVDAVDTKVNGLAYIKTVSDDNGQTYTATDKNGSVKIAGGNVISTSLSDDTLTVSHDALTAAATATKGDDTSFQKSETAKLSVDVVTGVTVDGYGHTTGWTTSTLDLETLVTEIGTDITNGDSAAAKTVAQTEIASTDANSYHLLAGKENTDGNTEAVYASGAKLDKEGKLEVVGLKVGDVTVKPITSATAEASATPDASISDAGVLTVKGVSAIEAEGTALKTNTYNAEVLQQSIFWFVEDEEENGQA